MDRSQIRANLLLLLAAAIWGFAFVAQRIGMEHVGPFAFNASRFFLGGVVLLPILFFQRKGREVPRSHLKKPFWAGAFLAGSFLFLGSSFQQVGIVYTTAGKAGFITGLYVVMVPVLGILWGQRVRGNTWLGVLFATVGMYLLSIKSELHMERGDALVLLSVLFWAGHVHVIGWLAPRFDSLSIAAVQFFVVACLSGGCALILEPLSFFMLQEAAWPIFYAGCLSVGVAYTLQVMGQRVAQPSHAAIILSLEAVFAVLGGFFILDESLTFKAVMGCVLMFLGMVVSQLRKQTRAYCLKSSE